MFKHRLDTSVTEAAGRAKGILSSRYGLWGLATISFVESALLIPILTDPFLVAYIIVNRAKAWRGIIVTLIASLLGGLAAYLIAVGLFALMIEPHLDPERVQAVNEYVDRFEEGTFLITFMGALTPIPYTLVATAAGLVKANPLIFILASLVGRGIRYVMVGWFAYRFGERALELARKQITLATIVVLLALCIYIYIKVF